MDIKKIIPREIQQLFLVGVIIFFALLFFGGRWLQRRSYKQLKKIKAERKRVELENTVANKLGKLKKIKEEIKVVNESSRFLAEIAKMTGLLNLKITSISAMPIEKRDEFVKLGVNLELDTIYHELGVFCSKLEAADIFITVESLTVTSNVDKGSAKAPRVNAQMHLTTFILTDTILER